VNRGDTLSWVSGCCRKSGFRFASSWQEALCCANNQTVIHMTVGIFIFHSSINFLKTKL
jgi:hypothetical protein